MGGSLGNVCRGLLICMKCRTQDSVIGADVVDAIDSARESGWTFDVVGREFKNTLCPTCTPFNPPKVAEKPKEEPPKEELPEWATRRRSLITLIRERESLREKDKQLEQAIKEVEAEINEIVMSHAPEHENDHSRTVLDQNKLWTVRGRRKGFGYASSVKIDEVGEVTL